MTVNRPMPPPYQPPPSVTPQPEDWSPVKPIPSTLGAGLDDLAELVGLAQRGELDPVTGAILALAGKVVQDLRAEAPRGSIALSQAEGRALREARCRAGVSS
jgi:hypothetical protein